MVHDIVSMTCSRRRTSGTTVCRHPPQKGRYSHSSGEHFTLHAFVSGSYHFQCMRDHAGVVLSTAGGVSDRSDVACDRLCVENKGRFHAIMCAPDVLNQVIMSGPLQLAFPTLRRSCPSSPSPFPGAQYLAVRFCPPMSRAPPVIGPRLNFPSGFSESPLPALPLAVPAFVLAGISRTQYVKITA
ncbi:hypothetical protein BD309DRAFT_533192 [Dichomitus squalens]|uniref:Uncharacterized protein n=1 Tax=Dichomitus squalens TaxID=114155 RepID=A0A4Q9MC70_9APHY|nr:hypothetical protein BD311DRAFT_767617 [Dichomitus squalens]TBU47089.1 hypothetical protein BD309DRAFT_533192 [Dichomitus squalens]